MKSFLGGLFFLVLTNGAKANDFWSTCRGSYDEKTENGQIFRSDFYIRIQNDLAYHSVDFNYLFTDADAGYLMPIYKKERLSKNKVKITVSFPNSVKKFAEFVVIYLNENISTIENFLALNNDVIVGPLALDCEGQL